MPILKVYLNGSFKSWQVGGVPHIDEQSDPFALSNHGERSVIEFCPCAWDVELVYRRRAEPTMTRH